MIYQSIMSVFLWLVYNLAHHGSAVASSSISSGQSACATNTQFDERSLGDIIWGCLATVFACSWVAVHPNIPPPNATWSKRALIRCELMVWTVVVPEVVILLAAKQWIAARQLRSLYRERGWTLTHGFFIQMGGFTLYDGNIRKGVLSPLHFAQLLYDRKISFPNVSLDEIEDRSKGDGLSKGLVLLQTTWFIAQLATRVAKGLAVTQLELATSGFAALNGFMYFFWWYKPLDMRMPISVYLIHPTTPTSQLQLNSPVPIYKPTSQSKDASDFSDKARGEGFPGPSRGARSNSSLGITQREQNSLVATLAEIRHAIAKAYWSRYRIVDRYPDYRLINTPTVPLFFFSALPRKSVVHGNTIAALLGCVFGAIHCAGWVLAFPSLTEERLWRVSSLIIVGYPTIFLVTSVPQVLFPEPTGARTEVPIFIKRLERFGLFMFCLPIYVLARLFILVEAFLALRNLPQSAFYAISWTTFLPHI